MVRLVGEGVYAVFDMNKAHSVNNLTVFQVMMLYCLSFSSKCDLPRIFIRKKNFPLSPL